MLVVGLTGGIGTGKTTFAALLAERGARVIDVDLIGHEALRPGKPAWHSVVDQFGDEILAAGTMEIDRKRLARIVFQDREKLAALNAIVHPIIFKTIADRLDRVRLTDEIVVLDIALLLETGLSGAVDAVVVIEASESQRVDRVVGERGMSIVDIRARMRSQADPADLRARADIIVTNTGTLEDLAREADRVWAELKERNSARR